MGRSYYSACVEHWMRFYARYAPAIFRSDSEQLNWIACNNALKSLSESERAYILTIYRGGDTIADNIYQLAKIENINQDYLWRLITNVERDVATRMKLI